MSDYFTLPNGFIVAEVGIDANGICGTGRAELPILVAPLRFHFRCPKDSGASIDFRELRCRVSPFDGVHIVGSLPAPLQTLLTAGQESPNNLVHLQIEIDRTRLALINRLRNGGDVKLRLDLELLADELVEVARLKDMRASVVWGLKEHHRMQTNLQVVIPRSVWIERVLPGTEFAKVHIIELAAVPIENCAGLKESFEALQQAQKLESQGFYREAVGKCRLALEPFFEKIDKTDDKGETKKIPVLKAAWQTRLGKATYDWLNASLSILKGPTNQAVHLSSAHFDQLEAQMFLAVTTAVVAYAIKVQPEAAS